MKNVSVKHFEFRPVVQGRCCFTDIPIFSSGDHFLMAKRNHLCSLVVLIMRNRSVKLF